MTAHRVALTEEDLDHARRAGRERQARADRKRLGDAHGFRGSNGAAIHEQGATAELAVARWLGVTWVAVTDDFTRLRGDVGDVQVRATTHAHGRLLLHERDPDAARYVLVRLHALPAVDIVGWIDGESAKVERYWQMLTPGRPCYVIPTVRLNDCTLW